MSYPQSSPLGSLPPGSLTEEGMRLLQAGDANTALAVLREATIADPNDGTAFQYLGIARAKTGDQAGGIGALREAARLLPMSAGVQLNLGVALAQAQQPDEARAVLQRARELDPQNGRIATMLASLPAQTTPAVPSPMLGGLGIMGGLSPVGLSPVGGAPAVGGLSSVGGIGGGIGGGLSSVGGRSMDVPASSGPSNVPTLAPPPSAIPQSYASQSSIPDSMSSMPAAAMSARMLVQEPSAGERMKRGLIWGAICTQLWTVWICFWRVLIGNAFSEAMGHKPDPVETVALILGIAGFFAFIGAIMGAIMAVIQAEESTGGAIGIVVGLMIVVAAIVLNQSGFAGIIFWFFTGRFIGGQIAARVSRPMNID